MSVPWQAAMCKAKIRLIDEINYVNFSIQNMHHLTSHKDEKCKYMSLAQRFAVKDAIRGSAHLYCNFDGCFVADDSTCEFHAHVNFTWA